MSFAGKVVVADTYDPWILVCLSPKAPLLWEDKVTAGFMPLKTSTSTEEIFAIVDAMQLTPEAS